LNGFELRDAQAADFPRVLALNEESVRFLSALTPERLALLHGEAAYHRVLVQGGQVQGFLLAFREGASYDSPNYRWFADRYPRFLYIDRIVIGGPAQGRGAGKRFYEDLFAFARAGGTGLVTCEIDTDPPNPVSRRFHEQQGFREVGSQRYGVHQKRVSLQAYFLPNPSRVAPSV
jgi:predicted GNAT superfamily acetyltransferase